MAHGKLSCTCEGCCGSWPATMHLLGMLWLVASWHAPARDAVARGKLACTCQGCCGSWQAAMHLLGMLSSAPAGMSQQSLAQGRPCRTPVLAP